MGSLGLGEREERGGEGLEERGSGGEASRVMSWQDRQGKARVRRRDEDWEERGRDGIVREGKRDEARQGES